LSQLKTALEKQGWLVDAGVGHSRFKCDLALRKPGEEQYRLGIFLDTNNHYQQQDVIERDLLKPQLLRNFGWRIVNLLSKDWYENPQSVLEQITKALELSSMNDSLNEQHDDTTYAENSTDKDSIETEPVAVADITVASDNADEALGNNPGVPTNSEPVETEPVASVIDNTLASVNSDESLTIEPGIPTNETITEQTSKPVSSPGVPELKPGETVHLQYIEGNSSKFWTITVNDVQHEVHYGRIGTNGQRKIKQYESSEGALEAAKKLLTEKLSKGYFIVEDQLN